MSTEDNELKDKIEWVQFALNNQIEWQKYAENKNLLLFTLTGGTLLSIFDKHFDMKDGKFDHIEIMFTITTFISFLVCVFSFIISRSSRKNENKKKNFIIGWKYVRSKTIKTLDEDVANYNSDNHLDDLLNEHLAGSKLTGRKYEFFNWGIIIYLLGATLLLASKLATAFRHV